MLEHVAVLQKTAYFLVALSCVSWKLFGSFGKCTVLVAI